MLFKILFEVWMHYELNRKLIAILLEQIFGVLQVAQLLYLMVTFERTPGQ